MMKFPNGIAKVDFGRELTAISTTVMGGGMGKARGAIFKTVPRDFNGDPDAEAMSAIKSIGGNGRWIVFLTAVDVNLASFVDWGNGFTAATAGLEPPSCIHTINVLAVSREPLNEEGLVDLFRTAVEAKALAAIKLGLMCNDDVAVGTVSDAVAVSAPLMDGGARFAGMGTPIGAAVARGVVEAVLEAAIRWSTANEARAGFISDELMKGYLGLVEEGLRNTREKYESMRKGSEVSSRG